MKPTIKSTLYNSKMWRKRMKKVARMRRKTTGSKRENVISKKLKELRRKYGEIVDE